MTSSVSVISKKYSFNSFFLKLFVMQYIGDDVPFLTRQISQFSHLIHFQRTYTCRSRYFSSRVKDNNQLIIKYIFLMISFTRMTLVEVCSPLSALLAVILF